MAAAGMAAAGSRSRGHGNVSSKRPKTPLQPRSPSKKRYREIWSRYGSDIRILRPTTNPAAPAACSRIFSSVGI